MSKILDSFTLGANFNFRYVSNEHRALIYVNEFKSSYHVSVRRVNWELPIVTGLILYKKYNNFPNDFFCSRVFIISSIERFLAVNHYLKENV